MPKRSDTASAALELVGRWDRDAHLEHQKKMLRWCYRQVDHFRWGRNVLMKDVVMAMIEDGYNRLPMYTWEGLELHDVLRRLTRQLHNVAPVSPCDGHHEWFKFPLRLFMECACSRDGQISDRSAESEVDL